MAKGKREIALVVEKTAIFSLILVPKFSTPWCLAFLASTNIFYLAQYCLTLINGLSTPSFHRQSTFWLERLAMILVAAQRVFPGCNKFWYVAVAHFGFSNMLYFAHRKKLSLRPISLPFSSFYRPSPADQGGGYYYWLPVAVFLLVLLSFGTVLDSVVQNFLYILVASFAVPAVMVKFIKPENLLNNLVYDTPETFSTRILDSKDPEYLFWFERAATILLLIAYGINHETAASSWYLAACLFAVTNFIYFTNAVEFILDVIALDDEKFNAKVGVKNESPSKEALKEDAKDAKAEVRDESTSKEATNVVFKAGVKDKSPSRKASKFVFKAGVKNVESPSKEASKEDVKTEAKNESPSREASKVVFKAGVKDESLSKQSSKEDAKAEVKDQPTPKQESKGIQTSSTIVGNTSELHNFPQPGRFGSVMALNQHEYQLQLRQQALAQIQVSRPYIPGQYYGFQTPGLIAQQLGVQGNGISPDANNAKSEAKDEYQAKEASKSVDFEDESLSKKDAIAKVKDQSWSKQSSEVNQTSTNIGNINQFQLQQQQSMQSASPYFSGLYSNYRRPGLRAEVANLCNQYYYDQYSIQTNEVQALREEKTRWEAEKKDLNAKLEENQRRLAKLENEKTLLLANNEALKQHRHECEETIEKLKVAKTEALKQQRDEREEAIEKLKSEVRELKSVAEHDQAVVLVLEQCSKDWVEEKERLLGKIERLKKQRRGLKSEKERLEEKLETSEARYEYYLAVTDDFAEKSLEWDAEKERLREELRQVNEQCELYKCLLRGGSYGTPQFPSL